MFGISDLPKFFLAFFLVLPLISFLHEAGHVFFAWLLGAKNIRVSIGSGKVWFRAGILEIRRYYFWYGVCSFENLKHNSRWAKLLIFSGGVVFNGLGALLIILLVDNEVLEAGQLSYQFTYFSLYYIFFALLPMPYPDGNSSDGKVMLDLLRKQKPDIGEKTFSVSWSREQGQWVIINPDQKVVETYPQQAEATPRALDLARSYRPSRVILYMDGIAQEIYNFPQVPL